MKDVGNEITKLLAAYTREIEEGLVEEQAKIAKEGVKALKVASPKRTGAYAKGWRAKKTPTGYTIHNKTHYQLTHLLENGHAKVNGGFQPGEKHIEPVEEKVNREYVDAVERMLSK